MGHTMTAQQPYPDFNKEKVTDSSENPVGDKGAVIILGGFNISIKHLSPDVVSSGFQPLHTFLNSLSRFIRQPKLQWTVQSIAEVCNNLPFKRP